MQLPSELPLQVASSKAARDTHSQDSTRQMHILTTPTDLNPGEVIYLMAYAGARRTASARPACISTSTRTPP